MIKAIKDKVVARLLTRKETASGIIIPNSVQEPQAFCEVISVGEDVLSVKTGEIVVAHMRGGMDVLIDKEIIKVLKEDEVYGILTDKPTIKTLKQTELKEESKIIKQVSNVSNIIQ